MNATADRPYHIARVITWLPPGGIEKRMAAILPRLNEPPFRVSVLCLRERGALADELERAGVPVHVLRMRSRLHPISLWQLSRWMRRERIDLVHSHMYRSNVSATIAARLARVRVTLCQVHNVNTWETWRQQRVDKYLCRWRTAMIAVSEEVKRDVTARLECPPDFVRVLYNGIDLDEYGHAKADPHLRRELGIREGKMVVVMLARLVAQKGHLRLLRALQAVRGELPPTHVLLVGNGKLREQLEREVRERRLDDMVSFPGHRLDVPQILAIADLSVLTSEREGFSNAIVESMAAGVPVVATNVGGNSEAIVDGESGLLADPLDTPSLAEAIRRVLTDPDLRRRLSAAARARAQLFSLDRMLDATRKLYLEMLGRSRK